jgi:hypothetical protein
MTDENAESSEGSSGEDGGLHDHIARWVEVLDRWVKGIDLGMGRRDGDPASLDGAGGDKG